MNWLDAFATGAANVFSWPGILIPVAGTLLAMVTSFLPGIGNASIVVLVMVMTMSWDVESVLLMFGALTGGATFMGSITAILFNIPGSVSSTPALLDGYPMGKRGLPRTAIACAATASAVGSVFGVLVLLAVLPAIRPLLLEFGPLERLLIGLWGLTTIIAVPGGSPLKAAAMTALGLLVALVGSDPGSGLPRWDFGLPSLSQGFGIVPVMLGIFTFSELIEWMRSYGLQKASAEAGADGDSTRRGIRAVFRHFGLTIRASSIGTLVGMIPGVGGTVAGFVAYGHAVQSARDDRSSFGKGDIRGVIAPEAAVDAKDGGSLLPAIAFGLPGSEAGVILLAVFALHGVVPGMPMLTTQLPLTFTLILALLFSNLLTSVVGVALTPWLARLKRLPIERIALPALILSLVTVVQIEGQLFDLYTAVGFGIAGYYWRTHDWPRVPFIIAFVLGSLIETNLALTVQLVEHERIVPWERPAAIVILALIAASLVWMRVRRSALAREPVTPGTDLALGIVMILATGVLLAVALRGGAGYSLYASGVAILAFLLLLLGSLQAWRVLSAGAPVARGVGWLAFLGHRLAPRPEHRLPITITALLPLQVWLLGLAPAVGLTALAWHFVRSGRSVRSALRAALIGAFYFAVSFYWVEELANLLLPPGVLWTLLEAASSR